MKKLKQKEKQKKQKETIKLNIKLEKEREKTKLKIKNPDKKILRSFYKLKKENHESKQSLYNFAKNYYWSEYREKKFTLKHKSDIEGTRILSNKIKENFSYKIYEVGKPVTDKKILDIFTKLILTEKKIKYILTIIEFKQDAIIQNVSDSFTLESLTNIIKYDIEIINSILNKKGRNVKYEGFELNRILIKVMYESSKTYFDKEKTKRNKK